MSERYRLVFRGEVLDGQPRADVKQRLGAALKVEGERLDAMFTGKAVTIRKDADTDTATRFQIAFKRAGARLRVLPLEPAPEVERTGAGCTERVADDGAFKLAPPGALMAEPAPAVPQRCSGSDPPHARCTRDGAGCSARGSKPSCPTSRTSRSPRPERISAIPSPPLASLDAPSWDIAELGADLGPHAPHDRPAARTRRDRLRTGAGRDAAGRS